MKTTILEPFFSEEQSIGNVSASLNMVFKTKLVGGSTHSLCIFMNQPDFFETYEWAEDIYDGRLRGNNISTK